MDLFNIFEHGLRMQWISSTFSNTAFVCNHFGEELIVVLYYKSEEDLNKDIDNIKKMINPAYLICTPRPFPECRATLTRTDWMIIKSLQKDPWKPYSSISKELKISTKTVKRRVTKLSDDGAIYLLVDVNMKSLEGIIPVDLFIFYNNDSSNITSASKDKTRMQLQEYLADQLIFFEPNYASDMDHFALVLTNISKSQEIKKWVSEKEGIKQAQVSILLDIFPQHKLYQELVEDMVRRQQQPADIQVKA